jgi:tripartite-type tricarboxylate transporter receptor subunit TctC
MVDIAYIKETTVMTYSRRHFIQGLLASAFACQVPMAWATTPSTYPAKPIRLVIPYPAGGATDNLGRLAGQALQEALGQPVVAENKGGGGTTIGTKVVATADPDGYTLGMIDSSFTINPGLLGNQLPYDTLKDFTPLTLMATAPFVLVVHPSVKAENVEQLIALAKAKPGQYSYGSAGVGSGPHLAGEQFAQAANIDIQHIPYRGGSTVITDVLGGQVPLTFATVPTMADFIKSGRLRALAVTSPARSPQLPDVPTFAEVGLGDVNMMPIFGVVGPAGLPKEVVDKIAAPLQQSITSGELNKRLRTLGFEPVGNSPEAFAQRINAEVTKLSDVIHRGNIKPN